MAMWFMAEEEPIKCCRETPFPVHFTPVGYSDVDTHVLHLVSTGFCTFYYLFRTFLYLLCVDYYKEATKRQSSVEQYIFAMARHSKPSYLCDLTEGHHSFSWRQKHMPRSCRLA
jgi:hypothetical protein